MNGLLATTSFLILLILGNFSYSRNVEADGAHADEGIATKVDKNTSAIHQLTVIVVREAEQSKAFREEMRRKIPAPPVTNSVPHITTPPPFYPSTYNPLPED